MTRFDPDIETAIKGIPCGIVIKHLDRGRPMLVTGSGFGDCEPPEPAEVEWFLVDRKGYVADWLYEKLDGDEIEEISSKLLSGEMK